MGRSRAPGSTAVAELPWPAAPSRRARLGLAALLALACHVAAGPAAGQGVSDPEPAAAAADASCPIRDGTRVCPAPVLEAVEEALDRAVHLTWRDEHGGPAGLYEVQRRRRDGETWGAWAGAGTVDGLRHLDDAGPDGAGLPAGHYAYRLRGRARPDATGPETDWSGWSQLREVTLHPMCSDVGGAPSGLPVVRADDRDGDGRYTGADLEQALRECSRRGGCVLEALPTPYDDVAIVLSDGAPAACQPERTACLTLPFPKGLVIQGHGSATVLRSPLWKTPYRPVAVLEVWNRPDVRVQLRNLVLDGRKAEQGDPTPGKQDSNRWWHYGFQVWNQFVQRPERSRGGCVHHVTVRNFMSRGVSLADVSGWAIEHSVIQDIGCHDGVTPCPRLRIPGLHPPYRYHSPGLGIQIGWNADDVWIRSNRILRVSKYSIGLKHGTDGSVASIRRPRVVDNRIAEGGSVGMFVAGVSDGLIQGNVIDSTRLADTDPEHAAYNDTFGISCMGVVEQTEVRGNRILNSAGKSVSWQCAGRGNRIVENRIQGSCRQKNPHWCTPQGRDCYGYPDFQVSPPAAGELELRDNEILDTGCASPIRTQAAGLDLVIRGGRVTGGPNLTSGAVFGAGRTRILGAARFEGVGLEFLGAARGVVTPSVVVDGVKERFRVDPKARVVVCAESPKACQDLCRGPEAPGWCAE